MSEIRGRGGGKLWTPGCRALDPLVLQREKRAPWSHSLSGGHRGPDPRVLSPRSESILLQEAEDSYTGPGNREAGQDRADFAFRKIRNAEGEAWLVKAIGFVTGETLFLFATEHGNNSVIIRSHLL